MIFAAHPVLEVHKSSDQLLHLEPPHDHDTTSWPQTLSKLLDGVSGVTIDTAIFTIPRAT